MTDTEGLRGLVFSGRIGWERGKEWEKLTGWRLARASAQPCACWLLRRPCRHSFEEELKLCSRPDGWWDHVFAVVDEEGGRHFLAQPYDLGAKRVSTLNAWCEARGLEWSIGDPPSFWFPLWSIPILISKARGSG